ncbi:hypothetical protein PIB30_091306 [Stylosanthes scabra]|uniref:Uncharacterized protein n=1 Tax=Stylosanthes scabra TaxID=79078 RepID=A0ABU6SVX6_9FABA|nr:hypothetical protein [Stylosanthes scabra]
MAEYATTAVSAAWCLILLASNQEWQDLVRAEALQICNGQIPDSIMLTKMKQNNNFLEGEVAVETGESRKASIFCKASIFPRWNNGVTTRRTPKKHHDRTEKNPRGASQYSVVKDPKG